MPRRRLGLAGGFAARRRLRTLIAVMVVLGATCGLSPSLAGATEATPYLDWVAATLRASSPGTEGKIWWVSKDSVLPPGWLLQTPNCWEQLECSKPPPGGAAIVQRMVDLISTARESVDFAELYEGPSITDGGPEGEFLSAIIRGLRKGHEIHPNQEPVVRVLIGKFPVGLYSAFLFAHNLKGYVGPWLKVQSASMRTQTTSWNHAKVLDVDGRAAIVGGMNYWNDDYLQTANPVNDLSMEVDGRAATEVSRYDDVLWTWTCDHRRDNHDVTLLNLRHCVKVAKTQGSLPNGTVPMMVVGHLGNGISVPGQPYGRESAPYPRPRLHGNLCRPFQRDFNDINNSRDYEYRNPGEPAVRALIQRAQKSIFISQQDLLSCLIFPISTEAVFDERLFAILAGKIVAGVPITIVLSAGGGGIAGYKNKPFTPKDVATTLQKALEVDSHLPAAVARGLLCQDVGLAALRNGPGATWANRKPFSNHAKLVAVDNEAFYIGSQNLYPGRLQELGVIVDNRDASNELDFSYIRPMWDWSKAGALINPATKKCDV
jgi:phosphatidylserine/phosphatidylglycerophosphate/cardiolipin synthase-like enzyme